MGRLRSALTHYGIELAPGADLERGPELDEALLWLYKANRRLATHVPAVLSILEHRLETARAGPGADEELRAVLDRLVRDTENRADAVADLARELRFVAVDEPVLDAARAEVRAHMGELVDELASDPPPGRRAELLDQLVACPQPLGSLLVRRARGDDPRLAQLLLEVLLRRFYRIRDLSAVERTALDGRPAVTAEYDHEGARIRLVGLHGVLDELPDLAHAAALDVRSLERGTEAVVELFVRRDGPTRGQDATEAAVRRHLQGTELVDAAPRRIDVSVLATDPDGGTTDYVTYRVDGGALVEDRRFRGLHAMLGKRNDLWRLEHFEIDRLPSVEDVYLFHAVAREHAGDERLIALAEVRDLTPVLDDAERVVALPDLERQLAESLVAIRHTQARRPSKRRYFWNQVVLHVRPPWTIDAETRTRLVTRLAPATRGLGLEKLVLRIREPDGRGGFARHGPRARVPRRQRTDGPPTPAGARSHRPAHALPTARRPHRTPRRDPPLRAARDADPVGRDRVAVPDR